MDKKKHILFVQPIFAPDKVRFERNYNSVVSLANYLDNFRPEGIQITLAFGGCPMNNEYWDKIISVIRQRFYLFHYFVYRYDNNLGKAYIINDIANNKLAHYDYDSIISSDSDIVFPLETPNIFQRLYNDAYYITEYLGRDWGVIALNQLECCCHLVDVHENKYPFLSTIEDRLTYHEELHWPNKPSGIAGGCLFINRKMWNAVGGYRVMGVYAGDDAYMLIDSEKAGYTNSVAETIGIIHPLENDPEYAKWKYDTAQRETTSGIKAGISVQIHKANEFWENRK